MMRSIDPATGQTIWEGEETAVAAMKAGLDDYVVKSPAHFVRLPVAARSAIERAAGRVSEFDL